MSTIQRAEGRFGIASRTAFDALTVDDVEDDSEDEVQSDPLDQSVVLVEPPPSQKIAAPPKHVGSSTTAKTAGKKAAKAERKLSQQAVKPTVPEPPPPPPAQSESSLSTSVHESPSTPAPVGTQSNPVAIADDDSTTLDGSITENLTSGSGSIEETEDETSRMVSSVEVTGMDGKTRHGNVEIRISSSKPVVPNTELSKAELLQENVITQSKKHSNVIVRLLTTLAMIGGFIGLLLLGHIYMIILVFVCQTLVYREVTALFALSHQEPADIEEDERQDPWSKTLNWYFFAVTNYFLYGETIIYYFKHVVFAGVLFVPFAVNHRFISFSLYCIGFVGFVTSLKKQHLKRQFSLFGWVHMSLLLIVVSSHFVVNNILEGMIWFWVPSSLVICNDVWAYVWGVTTGRTPLIKLSPKKTVEGFVGALFSTIVFGFFWGTFFMRFSYMTCPVYDLGVTAFDNVVCKPNPVFVWRQWEPPVVVMIPFFGRLTTVWWAPYQFHVLVMACFASLVAPFGGFFASGFKRAFGIKDFGNSIPGHGGMTDRMDCQFLMGLFTYVYFSTTIRQNHATVGSLLQTIVSALTIEEQVQLYSDLKRYLDARGAVLP